MKNITVRLTLDIFIRIKMPTRNPPEILGTNVKPAEYKTQKNWPDRFTQIHRMFPL